VSQPNLRKKIIYSLNLRISMDITQSFHWPSLKDKSWAPKQCILGYVKTPTTFNGKKHYLQAYDATFLSWILSSFYVKVLCKLSKICQQ